MTGTQPKNRSALAAVVMAVGTVLATLADLAGVAQLHEAPAPIIVGVLALAVVGLGLHAVVAKQSQQKGTSFWLVSGAMLCAITALIVTIVSVTDNGAAAQLQTETSSQKPQSTSLSSVPTSALQKKPIYENKIQLWLSTGVDIDKTKLEASKASAAAGSLDLAIMYYGNLQGSGKGFYAINSADEIEQTCRNIISSARDPQKEVAAIAGQQHCLQTSEGNIAWMQIVDSTTTAFSQTERGATIALKVWGK